ncbi:MAG: NHL repeat-containing protein [Polaribacter sp.]
MKTIGYIILSIILLTSCKEETSKKWVLSKEIKVEGVNPIGIAIQKNNIWLSDGDHNRLVQIDDEGTILDTINGLERPMHIAANATQLFVPEYGSDFIRIVENNTKSTLQLNDSLDAPAGFSVFKNEKAIADFYNHRILFFDGNLWTSFGKEGKNEGDFYYPTDVQITSHKIWVADAYNNRVQVFDKKGKFLKVIGKNEKMNAATGIFVSESSLFVTDFENDRVLVFDLEGHLQQEISKNIEKPTDVLLKDEKLYVLNYRKQTINVYKKGIEEEHNHNH